MERARNFGNLNRSYAEYAGKGPQGTHMACFFQVGRVVGDVLDKVGKGLMLLGQVRYWCWHLPADVDYARLTTDPSGAEAIWGRAVSRLANISARSTVATMRRLALLVTLVAMPVGDRAYAGDSGAVLLSAGQTFSVRINGVYRDIRVCNDSGSAGDLIATISRNEPVWLAPGTCRFSQGDRIELRDGSPGVVRAIYLVTGVHQS